MNVLAWPATPALPARDELAFDHPLGAEGDGHPPVRPLRRRRHENPQRAAQGGLHLGPAHDLGKVGRPDLLDRKSTRLNSSHGSISYAVFCLKKKKIKKTYD